MDSKILRIRLSFGSDFGRLRTIGSNRVQSGLVLFSSPYLQNKKRSESISLIRSQDIAKSLKIAFGLIFVSIPAIPVYTFQTNKPHTIVFIRSKVLVYRSFANGQTDRHFSKKIYFFFLIKSISYTLDVANYR